MANETTRPPNEIGRPPKNPIAEPGTGIVTSEWLAWLQGLTGGNVVRGGGSQPAPDTDISIINNYGSGTAGQITKWLGKTTLGDSILSEASGTITINGNLVVNGTIQPWPEDGGGGGGGGTGLPAVWGETPGGDIDGVNKVFTTAGTYGTALCVFLNGVRQSSPAHYSETNAKTFTMSDAPMPGDVLKVDYGETTGEPSGGGGGSAGYTGSGTAGYLTKWLGAKQFGDSGVSEGAGYLAVAVAGQEVFRLTETVASIKLNTLLLGPGDLAIERDGPDVLALRRAASPQAFRVYNMSSVDNTNFERVSMGWFSNAFEIREEVQGAGAPRDIRIRVTDTAQIVFAHTSVDRWLVSPSGAFCSALDNVNDIGMTETTGRPRDIWLGRNLNLGQDAMPISPYLSNLGAIYRKYLTLHCAELWVETLVAQNTMATIGGRILVGPTNILTRDVAVSDTVIYVKYNNFLLHQAGVEYGSKLWLESSGKFEMMFVTDTVAPAAESDGSFRYNVLRRQDGSPANVWYAGDAVMDTGKTGSGFIDLYSLRGIRSANEAGPTIVGNLRLSGVYNDWKPRWAIGNLTNIYGYGTTVFGVGLGDPNDINITIDAGGPATQTQPATPSQGFRIRYGSAVKLQAVGGSLYLTGELAIGTAGLARSGATAFDAGNGWWFDYNGGYPRFRVGNPQGQRIAWNGTDGILTVVGAITIQGTSNVAMKDFSNVTANYANSTAPGGMALDTYAVGGTAAATVNDGVAKARAAIDGAGTVFTGVRPAVPAGNFLTGKGLYLGSDVMGYYDGGAWRTYMDNDGRFYLHAAGSGNALHWQNGTLTVWGNLIALSGQFVGDVSVGTGGKMYSGTSTYGAGIGWLLEYNNGVPRIWCGDANTGNGFSWDGVNFRLRSNKISISENGIQLYADPNRDGYNPSMSIQWGTLGQMGLYVIHDVWNVEREFVLENSIRDGLSNEILRMGVRAQVKDPRNGQIRNASVTCHAQGKYDWVDHIEFDSTAGTYKFANISTPGSAVVGDAIWAAGDPGQFSYLKSDGSDERLKQHVEPFRTGMPALRAIEPIAFDRGSPGSRSVGFAAQNVRPVIPEATPMHGDYYGFYNRAMIAVMVNALKELDARLAALED